MGDSDSAGDFDDVVIKCLAHIVEVGEDECFGHVETDGDDVLCVLAGELLDIVDCEVWSEEEFFVIGELDYKRDIKDVL